MDDKNKKTNYGSITLNGRQLIASSWWGQSWCNNLERYQELENRLQRGRTFIRKGKVLDFTVSSCRIDAKVLPSGLNGNDTYDVLIIFKALPQEKIDVILKKFENIDGLSDLLVGSFSDYNKELFTDCENGLFPKPDEMHVYCDCLDYQKNDHICKHIAAVLYGIGYELDNNPLIFFELRGIDISQIKNSAVKYVWDGIGKSSDRTIAPNDAECLFGIVMDEMSDQIADTKLEEILSSNEFSLQLALNMKKTDESTKLHIKKKDIGKEIRERIKKPFFVVQYSLEGDYLESYKSLEEASDHMHLSITSIERVTTGYYNSAGGYQWRKILINEEAPRSIPAVTKAQSVSAKPVLQYTVDGKFVAEFDSIKYASKAVGVDSKGIRMVMKGKQRTAAGYIWKEKG